MKKFSFCIALLCLALFNKNVSAAQFHFDGNIANHNDVITINFSLASDATNVRVWTDSFLSGVNFDPITALWNQSTGALIAENDDNDTVAANQTYFDSGFILPTLAAGNYFLTITSFDNFAKGLFYADGFTYDGESPIPIAAWTQGQGNYWSVRLDSTDSTNVVATPIPGALWLFASAATGILSISRRSKTA